MNREKKISIIVFWLTFILTRITFEKIKIQKKKRSLSYRYLIGKDTEILNIYTKNYVRKDQNEIFNLKNGKVSNVRTTLKSTFWLKLLIKLYSENIFQRKLISEYICEMDSINKDATVIIHVVSEKEKCEYMRLRTKLYFEKYVTLRIKIVKFDEEQIFAD